MSSFLVDIPAKNDKNQVALLSTLIGV